MNLLKTILLAPFTLLYAAGIGLRNLAYENGWLRSVRFDIPVISIGNLSVGGTGKTPHTEYLIGLLKHQYHLGVLSRGYLRKSSGFVEVNLGSTAEEVGDEPLMYKWKHPDIKVGVAEERTIGIPSLLGNDSLVILLDDAFQHRAVKPGISILLTDYKNLYSRDALLPVGRLREFKNGADRADLIVVSKSPTDLSKDERSRIEAELNLKPHQYLFFSSIVYGRPYPLFRQTDQISGPDNEVLMVAGIADPTPMKEELEKRFDQVYLRSFSDHHHYTDSDIESIITTYKNLPSKNKVLVTTEKDATRLMPFRKDFVEAEVPVFCLPIKVNFAEEDRAKFHRAIYLYLEKTIETKNPETTHEQLRQDN